MCFRVPNRPRTLQLGVVQDHWQTFSWQGAPHHFWHPNHDPQIAGSAGPFGICSLPHWSNHFQQHTNCFPKPLRSTETPTMTRKVQLSTHHCRRGNFTTSPPYGGGCGCPRYAGFFRAHRSPCGASGASGCRAGAEREGGRGGPFTRRPCS